MADVQQSTRSAAAVAAVAAVAVAAVAVAVRCFLLFFVFGPLRFLNFTVDGYFTEKVFPCFGACGRLHNPDDIPS